MNRLKLKNDHQTKFKLAFTIIEVVLISSITGLIFLMVFIALPALQRSQRDTQRKNDLSLLSTAIQNYASNNKGEYPAGSSAAIREVASVYLKWPGAGVKSSGDKTFLDPDTGKGYTINFNRLSQASIDAYNASSAPGQRRMNYMVNARCPGSGETYQSSKAGGIIVWMMLEGVAFIVSMFGKRFLVDLQLCYNDKHNEWAT